MKGYYKTLTNTFLKYLVLAILKTKKPLYPDSITCVIILIIWSSFGTQTQLFSKNVLYFPYFLNPPIPAVNHPATSEPSSVYLSNLPFLLSIQLLFVQHVEYIEQIILVLPYQQQTVQRLVYFTPVKHSLHCTMGNRLLKKLYYLLVLCFLYNH